jgi:hypothetical protein
MNQPSPLIRLVVVVFFTLAITGFVAYRSGWIGADRNETINETPEVPATRPQTTESSSTAPADTVTPREKTAQVKKEDPEIKTIMESSKSIILSKPDYESEITINDSLFRYRIPDTLSQFVIDSNPSENPHMFSGSKSGYILRPQDIKPKMFPKKKLVKHL